MISKEDSIPVKNDNYRAGEDIFYIQFNDMFFYIEDEEQENFFFCILKKLFPEIRLEKIFPLGGKNNVIDESKKNIGNKNKVFIVDKDFDDILNKIEYIPNLFYLERYSIENYLIEEDSIVNYIISEKPKIKTVYVKDNMCLNESITRISKCIKDLIQLFLVVQNKCSHLKNINLNHHRFVIFKDGEFTINQNAIDNYKIQVEEALKKIDKRLTLNAQLKKINKLISFKTFNDFINNIPGKYILKMLKQCIECKFSLVSRNFDSFCYRIADKSEFNSLLPLRDNILVYVN